MFEKRTVDSGREEIELNELHERLLEALSAYRKKSSRAAFAVEAFILFRFAGFSRNDIRRLQDCSRPETISNRVSEVTLYLQETLQDFLD